MGWGTITIYGWLALSSDGRSYYNAYKNSDKSVGVNDITKNRCVFGEKKIQCTLPSTTDKQIFFLDTW